MRTFIASCASQAARRSTRRASADKLMLATRIGSDNGETIARRSQLQDAIWHSSFEQTKETLDFTVLCMTLETIAGLASDAGSRW